MAAEQQSQRKESGSPIPIFNWFDEPAKQSVNSVFAGINEGVEALDLLRRFRKAQFQAVKFQVSMVKILGMSTPVALQGIYSPAHVSTTISRRLFRTEWLNARSVGDIQRALQDSKSKSVTTAEEFVEAHQHVVILGGPGSGKTTFIKHLALAYTDRDVFKTTKLKTSFLPIFLSLPHFAKTADELFDFIVKPLVQRTNQYAKAYLTRALEKGLACVLLDSLDEVPVSDRKKVLDGITQFTQRFPEARVVITCRTADYEGWLEQFHEAELSRLSSTAVHKIINAWFRHDSSKGQQLSRVLKADRGVNSLTETPLLLGLLCIQFKNDLMLPKRKAELYRRCVDTLLREWDTSRQFRRDTAYSDLTDERKERLFQHIAGHFFLQGVRLVFKKHELIDAIASYIPRFGMKPDQSAGILNEVERHHGIVEQIAAEMYGFTHTSFQEYFVARDLLARRLEMEYLKRHVDDDNWSTVIEFMAAMHENPEAMLRFLMDQSNMAKYKNYPAMARRTKILWMIYRCMCAGATVTPEFARTVYLHIAQSQLEMARIYAGGGVYPIATLAEDGVKHSYYFFNRRHTLSAALQPYRMLSNEMILAPIDAYAKIVLENLTAITNAFEDPGRPYAKKALSLCLIVPLAPCRAKEVESLLIALKDPANPKSAVGESFLNRMINESLEALRTRYMPQPQKTRS